MNLASVWFFGSKTLKNKHLSLDKTFIIIIISYVVQDFAQTFERSRLQVS